MRAEHHAAHEEAQRRIRRVHESGSGKLSLANLALTRLPKELGELKALTMLRLDGCFELKDISSLRHCKRLAVLDLRACPQVMDLSPLRALHALRKLDLGIRTLKISFNTRFLGKAVYTYNFETSIESDEPPSELGDIDTLTDLATLETLTLSGCSGICSYQPLAALSALQELDLSGCEQLQDLQPLAALTALQRLNLSTLG